MSLIVYNKRGMIYLQTYEICFNEFLFEVNRNINKKKRKEKKISKPNTGSLKKRGTKYMTLRLNSQRYLNKSFSLLYFLQTDGASYNSKFWLLSVLFSKTLRAITIICSLQVSKFIQPIGFRA